MPIGSRSPIERLATPNAAHAARRPCSIAVAARLGKPITSPTAKMCSTVGAVGRPDLDAAALVGLQPRLLQVERPGGALAAGGVQHRLRRDALAAGELRDGAVVVAVDADDGLAEAEGDAEVAQVVLQRLDDLRVAELEQALALLDDRDARAERREHRRVLDADHAGADHDHRGRDVVELQDAVGVEDRALVERDVLRPVRRGAGRDHDVGGRQAALLALAEPRRRWCARRRSGPRP